MNPVIKGLPEASTCEGATTAIVPPEMVRALPDCVSVPAVIVKLPALPAAVTVPVTVPLVKVKVPPALVAIGVNVPLESVTVPPALPATVSEALLIRKALKSFNSFASTTVSLGGKSLIVILLECWITFKIS